MGKIRKLLCKIFDHKLKPFYNTDSEYYSCTRCLTTIWKEEESTKMENESWAVVDIREI